VALYREDEQSGQQDQAETSPAEPREIDTSQVEPCQIEPGQIKLGQVETKEPAIIAAPEVTAFGDLNPSLILPPPEPQAMYMKVTLYCRLYAAFKLGAPDFKTAMEAALGQTMEGQESGGPVGPKGPTSPVDRGILFHAIMEVSDFKLNEQGYCKLIAQKAQELGLTPDSAETAFLAAKAMSFQNSGIGRELVQTLAQEDHFIRREWPFWLRLEKDEYQIGPITLNGTIDLFFVNTQGLGRVVDYKLAQEHQDLSYIKQIEIYSLAIKKAGFKGEIKSDLWFSGN
jgi:hypothetical protein